MAYVMSNMFAIKTVFEATWLTQRGHNQCMRDLHRESGHRHRMEVFPRHFDGGSKTQPGGEYGYEKRSKKWDEYKMAKRGEARPLFFSGRMQRTVIAESIVRATKDRWTLQGKNYFPMTEQRRKELQTVPPSEQTELARWQKARYLVLSRSPLYKHRQRFRTS